jgi:small subunit ribosomal protein S16
MAVAIRLKHMGTKSRPFFRIIAVDHRKTRDGESLAELGHYNPIANPALVTLDETRVMDFLKVGAQPSPAVADILRQKGITRDSKGTWSKKA